MTDDSVTSQHSRPWHLVLILLFMGAIVGVSLTVQENYPFSHFPMYGNPNAKPVDYYFLTDGAGNPLATRPLTGDTAPRIKKRINTLEEAYLKFSGQKGSKSNIPEVERERIRREVLAGFIAQARRRGGPLPESVSLWKALIHQRSDGYAESFDLEVSQSLKAP